jgi:hypothetical protein
MYNVGLVLSAKIEPGGRYIRARARLSCTSTEKKERARERERRANVRFFSRIANRRPACGENRPRRTMRIYYRIWR